MFDKSKLNFWRLVFIFGGLIAVVLGVLWSSQREPDSQMMNSNMGSMMKSEHLKNTTIYDLLKNPIQENQMGETQNHHQSQATNIVNLSFISTAVIFLLLPFIIGGAITLMILWIK